MSTDMSKLFKAIQAIQEDFKCTNCKQIYNKKWCKNQETFCIFCTKFLPMRDTYSSILKDMDWHFLQSGETDRESFYPDFLDNLKIWANRFHVFPTKQDLMLEKELRDVKNWTRNEPDYDY